MRMTNVLAETQLTQHKEKKTHTHRAQSLLSLFSWKSDLYIP